jgi:hypothetical protein
MERKELARRGWRILAITAGLLLVVFVAFEAGRIYGKITTLRSEANRVYPGLLTNVYKRVMRGEVGSVRGMPMVFDEAATDLATIEMEFGPVEAFQLDYVESQWLGEHHTFSVQVNRRGVWSDEVVIAKRLQGLTFVSRADGPGRMSDSIVSPKSRKFPLHEKGKD